MWHGYSLYALRLARSRLGPWLPSLNRTPDNLALHVRVYGNKPPPPLPLHLHLALALALALALTLCPEPYP